MAHIVDDDDEVGVVDDFEEVGETVEAEREQPSDAPAAKEETTAQLTTGEEAEDAESYSKRVQKRINKLTQKVRQFEQESQYWRDKVESLEAKTQAKEFADFQANIEQSEGNLNTQIEKARAAKRKAIEEGDIDAQMKADDSILELREQLADKRRLANAAKEQAAQRQEQQTSAKTTSPAPVTIPDHLPDGTKQWLKANPWFAKGDDPKAADYARMLDASLQEEGYSPDDAEMYAELDKRLRVLVPRFAQSVKELAAKTPAKNPPKARVAGSSTDGQRAEPTGKPSRKLTSDDLTKMRKYGFDPNKAEHRKYWLKRNDPL